MRILFFADRLPPLIGGMEIHAKYFIEYFTDKTNASALSVVTKEQGVDYLILNSNKTKVSIEELGKFLSPDIVFFNSGRWIEELTTIRRLLPNAKFFYRTGGNEILKAPLIKNQIASHRARQNYWACAINDNIDILITNSLYTEQRLKQLGINTRIKRFVGGVNVASLKGIKSTTNDLPTIFCAARFVPYKNHQLMILVINELVLRGLKFRVKLAGTGPLFSKIRKQVAKYSLNSVVEFLGVIDHSKVLSEIFNADIYMQLSKDAVINVTGGSYVHSEGMGRAILEALSTGTFVIAGNSGALPEIVYPPYGVLINLNDQVANIADMITHLIKLSPNKMQIHTNFDWSQIFRGYKRLFTTI